MSIFLSVDPLFEKYPNINPYVYVANNPINAIDPDGKKIIFVYGGNRYTFDGKNLLNAKGQMMGTKNLAGTRLSRALNAYTGLSKLDKTFEKQIQTLIDSKNEHVINTDQSSQGGGSVSGGDAFGSRKKEIKDGVGVGSITTFNFSETAKKEFKESTGVENSDMTTVAHEISHQIDYDQGNMKDSYGLKDTETYTRPTEIRAVKNENIAREKLKMEKRTTYGGNKLEL